MSKPTWQEAVDQCAAYRDYLETLDVPVESKMKAILLTKEALNELLTQDGLELDGIRVYIGQKTEAGGEKLTTLVVVAVDKVVENGHVIYNDYNVPGPDVDLGATNPSRDSLGDERPCPVECSDPNVLNTGRTSPPVL
ncbi:MAG: hypothetical protein ACO1NW_02170 [Chitinophagaceae bacterium]